MAPHPAACSELESLELDKSGYERRELDTLSASLPSLTRLVLAGGLVGSHTMDWSTLAHSRLAELELSGGRAVRLAVKAPQLTSLWCGGWGAGPGSWVVLGGFGCGCCCLGLSVWVAGLAG